MMRRCTLYIGLLSSAAVLSACSTFKPPQISYDDQPAEPAILETEPPKPVQVVEIPKPLPLPGQLKPLRGQHVTPEPRDPKQRVDLANAAARVQPTRAGYINAVQVYPFAEGALYQVYAAPGEVTDIALEDGEQLVGSGPVAAGDTVRWIIGDTESGASPELLRPVDGVDEYAERVLAQPVGVMRGFDHDGEDRGPVLGRCEACILVAALDPGDAEAVTGGTDHTGNLDRNLDFADLVEGIVGPGVVVERDRALVGDEVIGGEPVLANDYRISRKGADVLDETREIPGDLWIGRLVIGDRRANRLRLTELVDFDHPRGHCAAASLPDQTAGETGRQKEIAERDKPPVAGLDAS